MIIVAYNVINQIRHEDTGRPFSKTSHVYSELSKSWGKNSKKLRDRLNLRSMDFNKNFFKED